jgi:hypothetical protein
MVRTSIKTFDNLIFVFEKPQINSVLRLLTKTLGLRNQIGGFIHIIPNYPVDIIG